MLRSRIVHHLPRCYSQPAAKSSGSQTALFAVSAVAGFGLGWYYYEQSKPVDHSKVYKAIADSLENANHDDGSFGPVLVRLAWHASGTRQETQALLTPKATLAGPMAARCGLPGRARTVPTLG